MKRLADSADYFGIRHDSSALLAEIMGIERRCGEGVSRVRLELNQNGNWSISAAPLTKAAWGGQILLVRESTESTDIFLHHKTTVRYFYEDQLAKARKAGFDEVLFVNESLQLTEGAISNYFFRIDGSWLTPPLRCGVLPGVRRAYILQNLKGAKECELAKDDLAVADCIMSCNALRGPRMVRSLQSTDQSMVWRSDSICRNLQEIDASVPWI
jgi:para-aminobenzoate synthetase/4-amino-4-deoxychorismate lyase